MRRHGDLAGQAVDFIHSDPLAEALFGDFVSQQLGGAAPQRGARVPSKCVKELGGTLGGESGRAGGRGERPGPSGGGCVLLDPAGVRKDFAEALRQVRSVKAGPTATDGRACSVL